MSSLLDFPGLAAAFVLALIIVVPVLMRALRQQNTVHEHLEAPGEQPLAAPPVAAMECHHCGQMNRVPLDAEGALCGKCRGQLIEAAPVAK